MVETEIAVVGAGPAGLSAAIAAAEAGAAVTLIDERPAPGGRPCLGEPVDTAMLLDWLARAEGELWPATVVWGIFDGTTLALADARRTWQLRARRLVLATGAVDTTVAFPGWTAPTVVGATDLPRLDAEVRADAGRAVIIGSGAIALAAARWLSERGWTAAAVEALAEPLLPEWPASVPLRTGTAVRAFDAERATVTLGRVGTPGGLSAGEAATEEAELIVLAASRSAELSLARLAGLEVAWDERRGGWLVAHDAALRTSDDRSVVAGDIAGPFDVSTASLAIARGWLAGLRAAASLGRLPEHDPRLTEAVATLAAERRRADALTRANAHPIVDRFPLPPGEYAICPCYGVGRHEIELAIGAGALTINELKRTTGAGMGTCQGARCFNLIRQALAARTAPARGYPAASSFPPGTARPPARPLPLAVLAAIDPEIELPPEPAEPAVG